MRLTESRSARHSATGWPPTSWPKTRRPTASPVSTRRQPPDRRSPPRTARTGVWKPHRCQRPASDPPPLDRCQGSNAPNRAAPASTRKPPTTRVQGKPTAQSRSPQRSPSRHQPAQITTRAAPIACRRPLGTAQLACCPLPAPIAARSDRPRPPAADHSAKAQLACCGRPPGISSPGAARLRRLPPGSARGLLPAADRCPRWSERPPPAARHHLASRRPPARPSPGSTTARADPHLTTCTPPEPPSAGAVPRRCAPWR